MQWSGRHRPFDTDPDGRLGQGSCKYLSDLASGMWHLDLFGITYTVGRTLSGHVVDGRPARDVSVYMCGITMRHRGLETRRPTLLWVDDETEEWRCRHYTVFLRDNEFVAIPDPEFRVLVR